MPSQAPRLPICRHSRAGGNLRHSRAGGNLDVKSQETVVPAAAVIPAQAGIQFF
ncbi:hypothetical protein [Neisseria meningitidis]|uniref:hypothetical protein n=1 Tax=Neisseria meningitidis TaxID=487 RepID=UPI000AA92494|nr:hypothetical protein [Neisseria meningitidis]